MKIAKSSARWGGLGLGLALLTAGCAAPHHGLHPGPESGPTVDAIKSIKTDTLTIIRQDLGSYCRAGEIWGSSMRNANGALYGEKQVNTDFVDFLRTGTAEGKGIKTEVGHFYFGVTAELKEKFNSCFSTSYKRMDSKKVLGWHVAKAAHDVGAETGDAFANWPVKFFATNIPRSKDYNGRFTTFAKDMNEDSLMQLEYFNELLTVGSPADRQAFKVGFVCHYRKSMTASLNEITGMGVKLKPVAELERMKKGVTCETPHMKSVELIYNHSDSIDNNIPSLIYGNHPLFAKDTDDLGFRVFTGEELYLRFYRRALFEAGLDLGKQLYHSLAPRAEGVEYLRNLALAVDKGSDINDFFAPGFLEGFSTDGNIYLRDMLCAVDKTACPVLPITKNTASLQKAAPVKVAAQKEQKAPEAVEKAVQKPAKEMIVASAGAEGPCYVHIGAYSDQSNIKNTTAKLNEMNVMNVLTREIKLSEDRIATQLRVGPFASRGDASSEQSKISNGTAWKIGNVACVSAKAE